MLRVYADPSHYVEAERKALNDIVKAFWNKATLADRRTTYGKHVDLFEITSSPEMADIHVLTMKWPYYVDRGLVDLARKAVDVARRARRPIAVFSAGDFDANFPISGSDIHVFQVAGYRSRRTTSNHGMPAFFDDPVIAIGGPTIRERGLRAVVGFCGQAGASLPRHAARYVRNHIRHLRWRLGKERWEPAPLEHTWFRQRVLDSFASSEAVETRFVLRVQYRAGLQGDRSSDAAAKSRGEFLENVRDTDYTVSVRGGGNFSVRFYEALAMGRIPAFVDTDCLLPYREQIDWRRYTVWIERHEIHRAAQIVADRHARMSAQEFRELQRECRQLWEDRLTPSGFYGHFTEHFPELR